ncbi:MAG TPA: isopeptide-forming domain-containing fimbrial protein [Candidatus Limousia pullorum]|uniref:Isopeptide-forming domain-containing fimbrial protein n=1 Tax=Candidatus Limousia pullorum TaxID=2840860 RepID=A0A9D1S933_9FIRM|nr:isopeptide-forming domain-containing fimbrial protein [Candidatus Limousia pullorum]
MKQLRKVMAVIFAVVLALTMTVTASAAETGSITIQHGGNDLNGVTFSAYKLFDITANESNDAQKIYNIDTDFTAFFTAAGKTTVKDAYDYVKTTNVDTLRTALAEFVNTNSIAADKTAVGTGIADITLADLAYGYYIIIPSSDNYAANLIMLDAASKNAAVKVAEPTVDKKADGQDNTSAQIGDKVDFTVNTVVPDMSGKDAYYFKLEDKMSAGLTFDNTTAVTVTIDGTPLTKDTDFTVATEIVETDKTKLTVEIKNFFINYKDDSGKAIIITYSAILNDKAIVTDVETNSAKVVYGTDPDFSGDGTNESTPDVSKVVDHTLVITDKDGSNNPLGGGVFEVKDSGGNKLKLTYDEENDCYVIDEVGSSETITLPNEGTVTIKGLDKDTYTVTQITPPVGYDIAEPAEISVTFDSDEVEQTKYADFINNLGTGLPETGGMGTVIFTVVGLALIAAVAGSFVISRKKKNS